MRIAGNAFREKGNNLPLFSLYVCQDNLYIFFLFLHGCYCQEMANVIANVYFVLLKAGNPIVFQWDITDICWIRVLNGSGILLYEAQLVMFKMEYWILRSSKPIYHWNWAKIWTSKWLTDLISKENLQINIISNELTLYFIIME